MGPHITTQTGGLGFFEKLSQDIDQLANKSDDLDAKVGVIKMTSIALRVTGVAFLAIASLFTLGALLTASFTLKSFIVLPLLFVVAHDLILSGNNMSSDLMQQGLATARNVQAKIGGHKFASVNASDKLWELAYKGTILLAPAYKQYTKFFTV